MSLLRAVPDTPLLANVETEYAMLACLLFDARRIDAVADILRPEDFSEAFFGRIYSLIVREHGRGQALNALTLKPFIEHDPGCADVGVNHFLANFANAAAGLMDHKSAARQLRGLARRRELLAGLEEAVALGKGLDESLEVVVDRAETALVEAATHADTIRQPSGADAMRALAKSLDRPRKSIRCKSIPSIDDLLGGMRPTEYIIGGGRPGMGKTATAISFSLGAAQNGHGVLFVSLEMGTEEIAARMAADMAFNGHSGVAYGDINSDNPSPRAMRAINDAEERLRSMPLHLIDAGSLTVGRLELLVRRYKRRLAAKGQSLDLVVVDYLQLLRCDERQRSAYEAVSEVSRRLKAIAKDHSVAVFALAQLSREVERRSDKKPQLSDLKESGQLEQDADAVLFFYRHEYYLRQDPTTRDDKAALALCEGSIDFIAAKVRRGITGGAVGQFHGMYQAVRG